MVVTWRDAFGAVVKIILGSILWTLVGGAVVAFGVFAGDSTLLIAGLVIGILLIEIGTVASILKFAVGLVVREVIEGFGEAGQTVRPYAPRPSPAPPPPVTESKLCPNCRNQVPTTAVFCPICGARQS